MPKQTNRFKQVISVYYIEEANIDIIWYTCEDILMKSLEIRPQPLRFIDSYIDYERPGLPHLTLVWPVEAYVLRIVLCNQNGLFLFAEQIRIENVRTAQEIFLFRPTKRLAKHP